MASKRRKKRRVCLRKQPYDKATAFKIAVAMRRQYDGRVVDAYRCPVCGQWHVGHRPWKQQQRISSRRKSRE